MSPEKIKSLLNKNNFDFIFFERVNSTMIEIKKLNYKKNICLMANEQTKGYGRRDTVWHSPKGNVYMSILYKNMIDIKNHFINNAYTTNIICDVIEKICKIKTQIKWPNDILINNKKISGIISEIHNINDNSYFNTGFGVNIISSPKINNYPTTSINKYKKEINNFIFVFQFMEEYLKNFNKLSDNTNTILEKYKSRLKYLGKNITLEINGSILKEGIFYDLNSDGSILFKNNLISENIYNARIIK